MVKEDRVASKPNPVPVITDELIQYLERLYRDVCPEPTMSDRDIWMHRGAVGVVRNLRLLRDKQRETVIGDLRSVS